MLLINHDSVVLVDLLFFLLSVTVFFCRYYYCHNCLSTSLKYFMVNKYDPKLSSRGSLHSLQTINNYVLYLLICHATRISSIFFMLFIVLYRDFHMCFLVLHDHFHISLVLITGLIILIILFANIYYVCSFIA